MRRTSPVKHEPQYSKEIEVVLTVAELAVMHALINEVTASCVSTKLQNVGRSQLESNDIVATDALYNMWVVTQRILKEEGAMPE